MEHKLRDQIDNRAQHLRATKKHAEQDVPSILEDLKQMQLMGQVNQHKHRYNA